MAIPNFTKILVGTLLTAAAMAPTVGTATAAIYGISGKARTSAPCDYYTSSNTRIANGDTIKVYISDLGPQGVKFRVMYTSSGTVTGAQSFTSPTTTFKTLTTSANKREFKTQFTCVTGVNYKKDSETFYGALSY